MPLSSCKGIFCIEGDWWGIRDTTTVEPMLQLLQRIHNNKLKYIRRDAATSEELDFYLNKWAQEAQKDYAILYLGFHGDPGSIKFGDKRKTGSNVTLDWIEERLEGKDMTERLIHFGSCSTLDVNGNRLNSFIRRTGVDAVTGYRIDVEWTESAAFETILLDMMQYYTFTLKGLHAMEKRIYREAGGLARKLQFRIITRK